MSESQDLEKALSFITSGQKEEAISLLEKLCSSKNPEIKLNATTNLLDQIDRVTENKKCIALTNQAIQLAATLGSKGTLVYLLSRKAEFLLGELTSLAYRQGNLKLAARVFQWIDFSLERDKKEYETIIAEKERIGKEIFSLEHDVIAAIQPSKDNYLRGRIFMSFGEIFFERFLLHQLDLAFAGRLKSKIMNIYYVKRWHLNLMIGFDKQARKKILEAFKKSINYYEKAIKEFKEDNLETDLAYALHGLAVKYTLTYRFSRAKKYLNQARQIAERKNEKALIFQANELEKRIKDKYKHPKNYVEELGLDLPKSLHNRFTKGASRKS